MELNLIVLFQGFVSSVVLSGYGFGSLIWIPMQTAFINPDNVNPDQDDYYTDPELLDRYVGRFQENQAVNV